MYHGITMGLAWGIFAPISIFIPFIKSIPFFEKDNRWLRIHFLSGMVATLLTTIGLALAVHAKSPTHSDDVDDGQQYAVDVHVTMGSMVFAVLFIQAFMGCTIPTPSSKDRNDAVGSYTENDVSGHHQKHQTDSQKQRQDVGETSDGGQSSVESIGPSRGFRTMILSSGIFDDNGMLIPSLSRYKQYLPSRNVATGEDKSVMAESTTIMSTALVASDEGREIRVAEVSPFRTMASSDGIQSVEVVDFSPNKRKSPTMSKYYLDLPHKNCTGDDGDVEDDVSELESLPPITPGRQDAGDDDTGRKSDLLLCWIYTHRFLGVSLFGMALYTCNGGIILQSDIDDNASSSSPSWTRSRSLSIFWGVTIGISVFMILLGIFYPCTRKYRLEGQPGHHKQNSNNNKNQGVLSQSSTASGELSC
jgi:hypothetical protein